ncbi:hypothetical protein [Cohnella sp.]|uniref:hypothetical protein n=1 Tax=Cohnella sp. TaxID=1883426 RepID=UPI0035616376
MEVEMYGLWIYIIYLIIPLFLGYKVASKIYIIQGNVGMSIVLGILFNLMFYIVGIVLWLIFCFTADIGWSIETFPVGGIIISIFAFSIATITLPVAFISRLKKLIEMRKVQKIIEDNDQF